MLLKLNLNDIYKTMKHVLLTACMVSLMATAFAQDEAATEAADEGP